MVMLQKRSFYWRENGDTEVVSWRENGHVTEVASLMEREWSCCGGGQFKGGRMVVTEVVSLMEREWSCYGGGQFN